MNTLPRPGIKPGSTAVKAPSLNHWTAREFPDRFILIPLVIRVMS